MSNARYMDEAKTIILYTDGGRSIVVEPDHDLWDKVVAMSPDPYIPFVTKPATKCTAAQARLAMLEAGVLKDAEAAVMSSDDAALKIVWEYGTEWVSNDPRILSLGKAIGLSDDKIDALFASAVTM